MRMPQTLEHRRRSWHQSIQLQLAFLLLAIITGIVTSFGMYQYRETRANSLEELRQIEEVMKARLGEYLVFPIWNMNFELLERTILSEMKEKRVYAILIKEVNSSNILQGKVRNSDWQPVEATGEISGDLLVSQQDIFKDGEQIGAVEMYLTTRFMRERLRREIEKTILTVLVLDFALLFALSIALRRLLIRPIQQILQLAKAVAEGDFTQKLVIRQRNEISEVAEAFQRMKETITDVLREMDAIHQAIQEGRLGIRGNAEAFSGQWREMIFGVNQVIAAFVTPVNTTSDYLRRLSIGEIPPTLTDAYRGDFEMMKTHLNLLIEATRQTARMAEEIANGNVTVQAQERSDHDALMQALNRMIQRICQILREMEGVMKSAQAGELEARGNAEAFAGSWRALVLGVNHVIDAFMNVTKLSEQLKMENLRMGTEMELAQRIQTSLLPKAIKTIHPDFEIAAMMIPAAEVGGDYYDVTLDLEGQLWFGIGDVSGHGVTPGLIMMMAQIAHAAITANYPATPQDVVCGMNRALYANVHARLAADHFMTFTALKYLGDGRFQYAGMHLDLLVYRQQTGACEWIDTDGVFLNFTAEIAFATQNAEFSLDVGDVLVLYTDGIIEAPDAANNLFGNQRLQACVQEHAAGASPEELREQIMQAVSAWCHAKNDDDMTVVVARRIQ